MFFSRLFYVVFSLSSSLHFFAIDFCCCCCSSVFRIHNHTLLLLMWIFGRSGEIIWCSSKEASRCALIQELRLNAGACGRLLSAEKVATVYSWYDRVLRYQHRWSFFFLFFFVLFRLCMLRYVSTVWIHVFVTRRLMFGLVTTFSCPLLFGRLVTFRLYTLLFFLLLH